MGFEIAGGTATGRSHALAGRPNQDAYAWFADGDVLAAVVCDGCGSGAHSEVGARLGARIVTARLAARLAEGASPDSSLLDGVRTDLLGTLGSVAGAMGGSLAEVVSEHFLFTVVGLAVAGERGCVFAAGDGIVALDGEVIQLGPFPRNEPPYLGYGLWGSAAAPALSVVRGFDARDVHSILLGTDGAVDLSDLTPFWEDDRHFKNRDAIRRRLVLLNREVALEDDTTVVVARWKKG